MIGIDFLEYMGYSKLSLNFLSSACSNDNFQFLSQLITGCLAQHQINIVTGFFKCKKLDRQCIRNKSIYKPYKT